MNEEHKPNRYVIGGAVALIAIVSALGLASGIDRSTMSGGSRDDRTSTGSQDTEPRTEEGSNDAPGGTSIGRPFTFVPEGAVFGELGGEEPVVLTDAVEVATLVESPDPGVVEVGVRISRSGGLVEVNDGEFSLVTDDGRIFTAAGLNVEPGSVVFTINAEIGGHEFKIVWQRANQVRLVLFSNLDRGPAVA